MYHVEVVFPRFAGADAVLGHVMGGRGSLPREQEIRRMKHSPGSGVLSVSVVPDGPTRILRVVDENKKVSSFLQSPFLPLPLARSPFSPPPDFTTDISCFLPSNSPSFSLHICMCVLYSCMFVQYSHTSPRDDWIVVENGQVAPLKSSDVDNCLESSWESEEDADTPTMELEVCV